MGELTLRPGHEKDSGGLGLVTADVLNGADVYNPMYRQWERLYIDALKSERSQKQAASRIRVLRRAFNIKEPGTIPWAMLTVNRVNMLIARLGQPDNGVSRDGKAYSNSGINSFIAVVKGVINVAINEGELTPENPAYRIKSAVKAVHTNDINPQKRPAVASHKLKDFLAAAARQPGPAGARNYAIFSVLIYAGLRRSEICWLSIDGYNRETRSLDFKGKGNKHRHVALTTTAVQALERWINDYRGPYPGAMFPRIRANDTIEYESYLQPESVNYFMRQIQLHDMELSKGECFSPHQLRYSFATRAMEQGVNLFDLQTILGHSNLSTTSIYTRRDSRHLDKWLTENMEL